LLITRIITAIILGAAVTGTVLFLPTPAAAGVLGVLWLAGAWEWGGLARLRTAHRALYVAVNAIGMVALFAAGSAAAWPALVVALVWWALALLALVTYPHRFAMPTVALVGFVVLLPSWLLLAQVHGSGPLGHGLAMTVLVIVWAADVGAYAVGRLLGRVKLAPAVSPGKTWEGVSGGVLFAALAAWVAALLLGVPQGAMVALGIATALISVVGDLTVSMFKRNVGLKDSGALLPGHGGVMDRIDSLTAAVPVFMLGMQLTGLAG
jgi:phosphatidate cytidylyltransferase